MSRVRIVFMGTPEFALPSLQAVLQDEHFEVVGVVTQPDRPAGRKLELKPSAVKQLALQNGLKVWSPEKVNQEDVLRELGELGAEVAVVVAFGQLLSRKLLSLFPFGCVNVHASLLPRWRGAAPMQRALMSGDSVTGVSLQKMVYELDAGDVLGERRLDLSDEMDARDVQKHLSVMAGDLLHLELMDYLRGNLVGTPQDPAQITLAPKIAKTEGWIDWQRSAKEIHNLVRGLTLGPVAVTMFSNQRLKIWKTRAVQEGASAVPPLDVGVCGTVLVKDQRIFVNCGKNQKGSATWLEILELQPESKKSQSAAEFLRGYPNIAGARLTPPVS